MTRHWARPMAGLALLTLGTLAAAGCSGGDDGATSPTGSASTPVGTSASEGATPSTGAGTAFRSDRYGFTTTLPPGWTARGATTAWDGGDIDHNDPYADLFEAPGDAEVFVLAAPTTKDLATYAADHAAWAVATNGCAPPAEQQAATIDGSPATRFALRCPEGIYGPTLVLKAVTVRNGQGVIMTSTSPDTGGDRLPEFDAILAALRWTEASG